MITIGIMVATRRRVVLDDELEVRTVASPELVGSVVEIEDDMVWVATSALRQRSTEEDPRAGYAWVRFMYSAPRSTRESVVFCIVCEMRMPTGRSGLSFDLCAGSQTRVESVAPNRCYT